jgi:hypothetical protein
VIQTLAGLVGINSVNPAYDGGRPESEIVEFIGAFFRARGSRHGGRRSSPDAQT